MVTAGPSPADEKGIVSHVVDAAERLSTPPRLTVVYLPFHCDTSQLVHKIHAALGVPVIGATTGGAAFTERGTTQNGAVAGVLGGDNLRVTVRVAEKVRDNAMSVNAVLRSFNMAEARRVGVLCFADAFACDGESLVESFGTLGAPRARLFGGTAGDNWQFGGVSEVFADGGVFTNAAAFAAIYPEDNIELHALHGFHVADDAREFRVTRIEGNRLHMLNDRPAAEVYAEELRRLGYWDGVGDFLKVAGVHELGAVTPFGEGLKIRAPLSVYADKSIGLGGGLREGESVRIVASTSESLIHAARSLADRVHTNLKRSPKGKLVFDCAARRELLGERYSDQVAAFYSKDPCPTLGMACYGELAKSGGTVEGFHNTTAVMAAW